MERSNMLRDLQLAVEGLTNAEMVKFRQALQDELPDFLAHLAHQAKQGGQLRTPAARLDRSNEAVIELEALAPDLVRSCCDFSDEIVKFASEPREYGLAIGLLLEVLGQLVDSTGQAEAFDAWLADIERDFHRIARRRIYAERKRTNGKEKAKA